MLVAGKQLVDCTPTAFDDAATELVLVVDADDRVGAELLALNFQGQDLSKADAMDMVTALANPPGGRPSGYRPIATFWMPIAIMLHLLPAIGLAISTAWRAALDERPSAGRIRALLVRDGGGALFEVDFATMDALFVRAETSNPSDEPSGTTERARRDEAAASDYRRRIVLEHGDGVVLVKQAELPDGDWVVAIIERGDVLLGRYWDRGSPLVHEPTLRFLGVDRSDVRRVLQIGGSAQVAALLATPPPEGHTYVAVFAAGGTTIAIHPDVDVADLAGGGAS